MNNSNHNESLMNENAAQQNAMPADNSNIFSDTDPIISPTQNQIQLENTQHSLSLHTSPIKRGTSKSQFVMALIHSLSDKKLLEIDLSKVIYLKFTIPTANKCLLYY